MDFDQKLILTVSQINGYIRNLLDNDMAICDVWVRGEISNFTYQKSGHLYFSLKDSDGQLKAVMFRSSAYKLKFSLQDGLAVLAHGRISMYQQSGSVQLYVDDVMPDGLGSLALQFEQLKNKLANEGLFDENHKKSLPEYPSSIGVITSNSGAAIHDILTILSRRFPLTNVILYPSKVQGNDAPKELIDGLNYFNAQNNVDVIIIGRGGGSYEDLWAFNDEMLARTIYASNIPVISAVGHQNDFTICDFVADKRASTPSAAAELAVPDKNEVFSQNNNIFRRISLILENKIKNEAEKCNRFSKSFVFSNPERLLEKHYFEFSSLSDKLNHSQELILSEYKHKLSEIAHSLSALSPLSVLERGYSLAQKDGKTILSSDEVNLHEQIEVQLHKGKIKAEVLSKE